MNESTKKTAADRDALRSMVAQFPASHMAWLEARAERNNRSRVGELAYIVGTLYKRDMKRAEAEVAK